MMSNRARGVSSTVSSIGSLGMKRGNQRTI
jgi:hypothetical protein